MHTRISIYQQVSGDYDTVASKVRDGFVPMLRDKPGFVSYSLGRNSDGQIVALNEWNSGSQAEQALSLAADWVKANIAEHVRLAEAHIVDFTFRAS